MLDYYARIADVMLPHIYAIARPRFERYPNGVDGMSFFEKHAPDHQPDWIATIEVPSKQGEHEPIEYTAVKDRPTLLWAANLAAIELHVPLWHVAKGKPVPAPPDYLVFDLDPGPGTTIVECCRVAQWVAERLGATSHCSRRPAARRDCSSTAACNERRGSKLGRRAHDIAKAIERDHPEARWSRRCGRISATARC